MYFDFFVSDEWLYLPSLSIRTIYKLFTDSSYFIDHHIIDPDKYILFYTMEGHGTLEVGEKRFEVGADDLVFANTDSALRYWCTEKKWNFWLVEFKSEQVFFNPNYIYSLPFRVEYHTLFNQALSALKSRYNLLAASYFQVICFTLFASFHSGSRERHTLFSRCRAYMGDHLSKFTVEELCLDMNISRRTISNLFSQMAGISPYQYYQRFRAERSKEYLENTDMSIAQIAALLGYHNSGHYSRIYKTFFNKTPRQYRAEFLIHT